MRKRGRRSRNSSERLRVICFVAAGSFGLRKFRKNVSRLKRSARGSNWISLSCPNRSHFHGIVNPREPRDLRVPYGDEKRGPSVDTADNEREHGHPDLIGLPGTGR